MPYYNTLIVLSGTCLLGMVAGVIGSFAVLRGRALLGDALAHAALPGLCVAFLIVRERSFPAFLGGAMVAGAVSVLIVIALRHATRIKDDAVIGIVLSVSFGLGIALSRLIQNMPSGNRAGLDNYIYGKAAGMLLQDVLIIGGVGVVVLIVTVLLLKEFTLLSFDGGFAAVQGWPVRGLDVIMMGLLVMTTVMGLPAVGVVLMAAMLILPGAAARFWTERLARMLVIAAVFGGAAGVMGTLISARYERMPTGPVIVLCGAAVFLVSMLFAPRRGVVACTLAHMGMRRRIAWQNLLRTLFEIAEQQADAPAPVSVAQITTRRSWPAKRAASLLRRAVRRGVVAPVGPDAFTLTDAGRELAAGVVRAHRLWELFLIEEADIAADHVDRDADEIEHVLPRDLVERLENKLARAGRLPPPPRAVPPSPHAIAATAGDTKA